MPCPECGSTAREYHLGQPGTIIETPPGIAEAVALPASAAVELAEREGTFTRQVTFSRNEAGAWFGEIHKPNGDIVAVQVAFDREELYLILADDLLPPDLP